MKTRSTLLSIASAIALIAAGSAYAQTQAPTDQKSSTARTTNEAAGGDNAFIVKATNAGFFEIESSKIAIERTKNADVKKFAEQMVADHTKADKELKSIAKDKVPAKPDAPTVARVEKLKAADADKFDALYIDEQKAAHDEAVGLFTKASENVEDPKLKAFAEKTLPVLKQHQEHVKQLNAK